MLYSSLSGNPLRDSYIRVHHDTGETRSSVISHNYDNKNIDMEEVFSMLGIYTLLVVGQDIYMYHLSRRVFDIDTLPNLYIHIVF